MQVIIDEVVSRVRAIDGASALAPETMRSIVDAVMAALREEMAHDRRICEERSLDNGYLERIAGGRR